MTSATALTTTGGGGGSGWTRRLNPNQVELCKKLRRDQIELETTLVMEGTYSRIHEAQLLVECTMEAGVETGADDDDENPTPTIASSTITTKTTMTKKRVMVKLVTERASKEQSHRMLIESAMLRGLKHKNICAVLGVYLGERIDGQNEEEEQQYRGAMSVFPYFEIGNMKTFLTEIRERKMGSSRHKPDELDEDVMFLFFWKNLSF